MSAIQSSLVPDSKVFYLDIKTATRKLDSKITEIAVGNTEKSVFFVGYITLTMGGSARPIPSDASRYPSKIVFEEMHRFIEEDLLPGETPVLMGYKVKGWNKPVIANNLRQAGLPELFQRCVYFDLAEVASTNEYEEKPGLGFPPSCTQYELERALLGERSFAYLPANRNRAYSSAVVIEKIWSRMLYSVPYVYIRKVLLEQDAEKKVSVLLRKYDPSLAAKTLVVERILRSREEEAAERQNIVVVYDLKTTGLPAEVDTKAKAAKHHNKAIRIIEFGALILPDRAEDAPVAFHRFVNPRAIVSQEGISSSESGEYSLGQVVSIGKVWADFIAAVESSPIFGRHLAKNNMIKPSIVLVGYKNSTFDNPILTQELLRHNVDFKRGFSKKVFRSWDAEPFIKTTLCERNKADRPKDFKLETVANFLQVTSDKAYRATVSVELLAGILTKMVQPFNVAATISAAEPLSHPGINVKRMLKMAREFLSQRQYRGNKEAALQEAARVISEEQELPHKEPKAKLVERPSLESFLVRAPEPAEEGEYLTYI